MKKKFTIISAVILVILTAAVAWLHMSSQEDITCMVIRQGDTEIAVSFEDLDQTDFSGELVNGKGDITANAYRGILMADLLSAKEIDLSTASEIIVTSADNYSATFAPAEITDSQDIYIAITKDGETVEGIDPGTQGTQIIAFCDNNSQRCVRYASIIEVK